MSSAVELELSKFKVGEIEVGKLKVVKIKSKLEGILERLVNRGDVVLLEGKVTPVAGQVYDCSAHEIVLGTQMPSELVPEGKDLKFFGKFPHTVLDGEKVYRLEYFDSCIILKQYNETGINL